MGLPVQSERSLKHKPTDSILPLKARLSCLQLLGGEVRLYVSDLDVSVLLVETGGIYLRREGGRGREEERGGQWREGERGVSEHYSMNYNR